MRKLSLNILIIVIFACCGVPTVFAYSVGFAYDGGSGGWDINMYDFITPTNSGDVSRILSGYDLDVTYNKASYTYSSILFTSKLGSPADSIDYIGVDVDQFLNPAPGLLDIFQQSTITLSSDLYSLQSAVSGTFTLATLFFGDGGASDLNLQFTNWYLPGGGIDGLNTNDIKAFDNTILYDGSPPVPEPGTILLLGSGLAALIPFRRKLGIGIKSAMHQD